MENLRVELDVKTFVRIYKKRLSSRSEAKGSALSHDARQADPSASLRDDNEMV
jgi:hypothetical protein